MLALNNNNFGAVILAAAAFTGGCSREMQNEAPPESGTEIRSGIVENDREQSHQSQFYFKPPSLASADYSIVKSSPDGFSEEQSFYLNNAIYLLKNVFQHADRQDLAKGIETLKYLPMSADDANQGTAGGIVGFARYSEGIIYVNNEPSTFNTPARLYILLAAKIAHEFCHHLAGDETINEIGSDATKLFTMEHDAHQRTVLMCNMIAKYIDSVRKDMSDEDYQACMNAVRSTTTISEGHALRYEVRRDVCQMIYNEVDRAAESLNKKNALSEELSSSVGAIMLLSIELREAPENGANELSGYRLLLDQARLFANRIQDIDSGLSKALAKSLDPVSEILLRQEEFILKHPTLK